MSLLLRKPSSHYLAVVLAVILLSTCVGLLVKGDKCFGSYYTSGIAIRQGLNPFAAYAGTVATHNGALIIEDVNLNPPITLPVFQVMSHLPYNGFSVVWTIGSVLFLVASIGLLRRQDMQMAQLLYLALSAPVFDTIFNGQIYFVLMFLSTLVWVLRDREMGSSIILGILVAVKPTVAFWPLFLFLSGRRRYALRSFIATAIASLLPIAIYGTAIYRQWFAALKDDPHWTIATNIALMAEFRRIGVPTVGITASTILGLYMAWLVWKHKPSFRRTSGVALCLTILCAPLGWYDYTLILAPVFVGEKRWGKVEMIAALLLTIPLVTASLIPSRTIGIGVAGQEGLIAVFMLLTSFIRGMSAGDVVASELAVI